MSDGVTILWCIGAAKAGTTWLYRYLRGHPDCHLRAVKELHYFNSVDLGGTWQAAAIARARARRAERLAAATGVEASLLRAEIADHDDLLSVLAAGSEGEGAYYDYLRKGAGPRRLVADITPAYALLPEARLAGMAQQDGARFLYMMRDPVERLWSHVRMIAARRLKPGEEFAPKAERILRRALDGEETEIVNRGDYAATIERLCAAVPAAQRLVAFTERLITADGVAALCQFLGISPRPAHTAARVHAGQEVALPAAARAAAARFLRPQYDYVEHRFGPLPEAWAASLARA